jgi:hypothetical protein
MPSLGARTNPVQYRVRNHPADSWFHVRTGPDQTIVVITPTANGIRTLLPERFQAPVVSAQFFEETAAGLQSAFLADGQLSYPEYPSVAPITIRDDDFFLLGRTTDLEIRQLSLWQERPGLAVTLQGRVAEAAIREVDATAAEAPSRRSVDPRLTLLHMVRHGPLWQLIGAVAAWGLATTWLWYERWKKLAEK